MSSLVKNFQSTASACHLRHISAVKTSFHCLHEGWCTRNIWDPSFRNLAAFILRFTKLTVQSGFCYANYYPLFAFCLFVNIMELLIGALPVSKCSLIGTVTVNRSCLTDIRYINPLFTHYPIYHFIIFKSEE